MHRRRASANKQTSWQEMFATDCMPFFSFFFSVFHSLPHPSLLSPFPFRLPASRTLFLVLLCLPDLTIYFVVFLFYFPPSDCNNLCWTLGSALWFVVVMCSCWFLWFTLVLFVSILFVRACTCVFLYFGYHSRYPNDTISDFCGGDHRFSPSFLFLFSSYE